jgi:hypothetical protein
MNKLDLNAFVLSGQVSSEFLLTHLANVLGAPGYPTCNSMADVGCVAAHGCCQGPPCSWWKRDKKKCHL